MPTRVLQLALLAIAAASVAVPGLHDGANAGTFPGLNGRIAFASARGGTLDIYTMTPDGGDVEQLTRDLQSTDIDPSWSVDGKRLAFTSNRGGSDDIYVMASDGSGQTRLTTDPASDVNPSWSPGGRNIAFVSGRDGDAEIFVMNEDGSGQTQLTRNGVPDAVPSWSPDGTRIAFTSWRDGNAEIYVMNVDGGSPVRLTASPRNDVSPSWSPDGSRIAFASDRDGNYEIYAMQADGSVQLRLTRNLEVDLDPVWSPDGTRIAFTTNRDGNYELYAMAIDGSQQLRLSAAAGDDTTADWQAVPDLPTAVEAARFVGSWRESEYRGVLEVAGAVPGPARFGLLLRRGAATVASTTTTVGTGSFVRRLPLAPSIVPGEYTLDVAPAASPTPLRPQRLRPVLAAPPEGVVSRAWASGTVGGPAEQTIPASNAIVFAHFRFVTLPKPGRTLRAVWNINGRRVGAVRKTRARLVIAWLRVEGGPLPRGRYECVVHAGTTVAERLRFRVA